jgi:hypothetical protein
MGILALPFFLQEKLFLSTSTKLAFLGFLRLLKIN